MFNWIKKLLSKEIEDEDNSDDFIIQNEDEAQRNCSVIANIMGPCLCSTCMYRSRCGLESYIRSEGCFRFIRRCQMYTNPTDDNQLIKRTVLDDLIISIKEVNK